MGGLRRPLRSKVLPSGNVCLHSGNCCCAPTPTAIAASSARLTAMMVMTSRREKKKSAKNKKHTHTAGHDHHNAVGDERRSVAVRSIKLVLG